MGTPKPRILPWLLWQLDLEQLEGVVRVDQSCRHLHIPWKDILQPDAQHPHLPACAKVTPGKDKPHLLTHKRNFQSSLHPKKCCIQQRTDQGPPGPA